MSSDFNEDFDFGSDDDLELDFSMDSNDGIIDFGASNSNSSESTGFDLGNTNSNSSSKGSDTKNSGVNNSNDNNGITKTKKVIILCFVASIVILVIVSLAYRFSRGKKVVNNKVGGNEQQVTVINTDKWKEFSGDVGAEFGDVVISSMIVSDIKNKALIVNALNDMEIKVVASGSIEGLRGTYEIELPYTKASKLSEGMEFRIKYRKAEHNGYLVITDLTYAE